MIRSRIANGLCALCVSAAALAVGTSGAAAATGDPYASGCANDAAIVRLAYYNNSQGSGRVELWYSYSCNTNWAVNRSYSGSRSLWAGVWAQDYGRISGAYENLSGYPWIYTNMIDGSTVNCAGGDNSGGNGPETDTTCV